MTQPDTVSRVATSLARRCRDRVILLHDRRVPGTRASIGHLAVAPGGVWVIDSRRHPGKLEMAGREGTPLVAHLAHRVQAVTAALAAGVPVHGVLCLVGAELPASGALRLDGHSVLCPRTLARRLNAPGVGVLPGEQSSMAAIASRSYFSPTP